MRVLVLGHNGLLGSELFEQLEQSGYTALHPNRQLFNAEDCSVEKLNHYFTYTTPDIVVNCIAMTDVDGCEQQEDKAAVLNGIFPYQLAKVTEYHNVPLIHLSTDYVFGTSPSSIRQTHLFTENDFVDPLNVYGETKLAGEENVRDTAFKHYILRTSWLFANSPIRKTWMQLCLEKDWEEKVPETYKTTFGTPTYVPNLAHGIVQIINSHNKFRSDWQQPLTYGTYHMANYTEKPWTKMQALRAASEALKDASWCKHTYKNKTSLVAAARGLQTQPQILAKRPINSALSTEKIISHGIVIGSTESAITRFVGSITK